MIEKWKEISAFPYSVSSWGRVRNDLRGNFLKGSSNQKGYLQVDLKFEGRRMYPAIHTLVALYFIGKRPGPRHQINHLDGNKLNNKVENLEYVTPSQNVVHSISLGLKNKSKMSLFLKKKELISKLSLEGMTKADISRVTGIPFSSVRYIAEKRGIYGRLNNEVI